MVYFQNLDMLRDNLKGGRLKIYLPRYLLKKFLFFQIVFYTRCALVISFICLYSRWHLRLDESPFILDYYPIIFHYNWSRFRVQGYSMKSFPKIRLLMCLAITEDMSSPTELAAIQAISPFCVVFVLLYLSVLRNQLSTCFVAVVQLSIRWVSPPLQPFACFALPIGGNVPWSVSFRPHPAPNLSNSSTLSLTLIPLCPPVCSAPSRIVSCYLVDVLVSTNEFPWQPLISYVPVYESIDCLQNVGCKADKSLLCFSYRLCGQMFA